MKSLALLPIIALAAACGGVADSGSAAMAATGGVGAADAAHPTVVELYQSQGCSSCPPAIANVNGLADRPDILPLMFAVTYWDQLGWKDTFATPAYTERQWDYAHMQGRAQVATPQVIVNGRAAVFGGDRASLLRTIAANARGLGGPSIARTGAGVEVGAGTGGGATVWLVQYDPRPLSVPIRAGENGGRTLVHRDIVRSLTSIGTWSGAKASFALPANNSAYKSAILIQRGKGGPIVAAARI